MTAGPLWAAAGTGIQVGAAIVATRYVVDAAGPASLGFLRYLVGLLCLAPALLLAPWKHIAARDMLPIGLLGVGQFGLLIVLLNYSLLHLPVARASLLFATFPLMTMLLSAWLGLEEMTRNKIVGSLIAFIGVAITLGSAALAPDGRQGTTLFGTLAAVGAAFCGAACSVFYRPYVARYSTLHVTAFAMLAAVVMLGGLAAGEGLFASVPRFTLGEGLVIAFIGISSGVGFFLWVYALGNASPTLVSMFLSLSPVTAVLGGAVLLGEDPPLAALGGLVAVLVGLWVALRPPS
ncbi:MAG: DMT family transporter [Reyranella sp.]|nr:DMT family transporter [Reyranella sp.]